MTPKELAIIAAKALDEKKGKEISAIEITDLTTLADYFVICTATSNTQVKAMSDACEEAAENQGEKVHHIEGHRGGQWTLLDYSAVVVHVFTQEGREFYGLERLWSDAQPVDISKYLTAQAE